MTTKPIAKDTKKRDLSILILVALLIPLYLGYIDEGYFNFEYLKDPGSVIALLIYGIIIFVFQYAFYGFVFKNTFFKGKVFVSVILGIVTGLSCAFAFFLGMKYLM